MLLEMNVKLRRGQFDLTTRISVDDSSVGLFGKSGAGKSTVLGLIAGTIQPQSGHIILDGKILFDSRKGIMMLREQRPVGAVLQIDSSILAETVRDNLASAFREAGLVPKVMLEIDWIFALYAHVRSTGLYSIVPHSLLNLFEMGREVTALPLNPELSREIGLISLRQEFSSPLQVAAWNIAQRLDLQHRFDSLITAALSQFPKHLGTPLHKNFRLQRYQITLY